MTIYRPPNQPIGVSLQELHSVFVTLKSINKPVIICTDHNLDLIKAGTHPKTQEFWEMTVENDFLCTITKPTRITHQSATLIDNIFINKELSSEYKSWILQDDLSDHLPCLISLAGIDHDRKQPIKVWKQKMDQKSINKRKSDLTNIDWPQILSPLTCEEAFECFHATFMQSLDKHCSEKSITKRGPKSVQPWITKGLKRCISKKRNLYNQFLKQRSNTKIRQKYIEYRSCLQWVLRKSKNLYYSNLCATHKNNTKRLWGIINKVMKKSTNKTNIIESLNIDNLRCFDSEKIANKFGQYFANIGKNYVNKIDLPKHDISDYNSQINENATTMFLYPTDSCEVRLLIDQLKPKKSSGYDDISNHLIKELKDQIIVPFTVIINKSIQEGVFPQMMKTADVIPLFKSKDKLNKENYRPISLLLTLSKILKKVVYKHTYEFMEKTQQLYDGQFGFRSKHSCKNVIQNLLGDILKSEDQGLITKAVFLNLSKAFDTLNHKILFEKMYKYGIKGQSLQWFKSYQTDRQMRVKCQTGDNTTSYSDPHKVSYGTPQGSCLGPLLFSIFTNDLSQHLKYTKCILFADDTTIYMSHRNVNYLSWCIEED